jgi:hypothetical protein
MFNKLILIERLVDISNQSFFYVFFVVSINLTNFVTELKLI